MRVIERLIFEVNENNICEIGTRLEREDGEIVELIDVSDSFGMTYLAEEGRAYKIAFMEDNADGNLDMED